MIVSPQNTTHTEIVRVDQASIDEVKKMISDVETKAKQEVQAIEQKHLALEADLAKFKKLFKISTIASVVVSLGVIVAKFI